MTCGPLAVSLFTTCVYISTVQTQQAGFPPVVDVSRDQPVMSHPSSAVCGLPTESSFCRSRSSSSPASECEVALCTSECPVRSATPSHVDLLSAVRSARCVVRDERNVKPTNGTSQFSVLFRKSVAMSDPATCYLRPPVNPTLGARGSFTFTFWIRLDSTNTRFVYTFSRNILLPRHSLGSSVLI